MRLADAGGGPDLDVRFDPGAGLTAADLLAALPAHRGPLVVDGALVEDGRRLVDAGLADGAMVGGRSGPTATELAVIGGPLPPAAVVLDHPVLVGRGAACSLRLDHPTVAPAHVLVEPDHGSWTACSLAAEGTRLDGTPLAGPRPILPGAVLSIGAIDLEIVDGGRPAAVAGPTAPVHRAPRPLPPAPPDPGPEPEPPAEAPPPSPPGALSLLLPVGVGAVLAVAIHPTAGLITALTPLLAVGAHLDARRRHRRDRRRALAAHEVALGDHVRTAEGHARRRAASDRSAFPTPGRAITQATLGDGLWPVRGDGPAFVLAVGWTDDDRRAPVTVTVDGGAALGIAGPLPWAHAVTRALVVQATARLGPSDLHLSADSVGPWAFTRWLPHRGGSGPSLSVPPCADGAAIEVAEEPRQLTDRCAAVLTRTAAGALLTDVKGGREVVLRPVVAGQAGAERYARLSARWSDAGSGADVPDRLALTELVPGPDWVAERDGRRALAAPLGRTATGPAEVDLVAHGPHALVAGTTGAGKSELLRTWVTALALRHPPTAVAFVLVDYKGGSAFDACAHLPHVTGVVTDLDDGLGERLLVALRAEVRDRERQLRAAGAPDLRDLDGGPPRLVVVVDEFATLAAELPDFLGALVDVARRGRSLGLHLVLATQRPAGAVSDDIRANTALRLCLRTLDPADSQDVLGNPAAADLPADRPGRAWLRITGAPVLAQIATTAARTIERGPPLLVRRVGAPWPAPAGGTPDLDLLVTQITERWGLRPSPPATWCPPLPDDLAPPDEQPDGGVALGREDRPAERRQPLLVWEPDDGHLVVFGRRGSGGTTTVLTALLGLAQQRSPADLHLHLVSDRPGLDPIARLPHVGTVVRASDRASLRRLLGRLRARTDGRAAAGRTVVALDGYESLTADLDDLGSLRLLEDLDRLARGSPANGISLVITSRRPVRLPPALLGTAAVVLTLALDDPSDSGLLGLPPATGSSLPGRGRTLAGDAVQVFRPGPVAETVAAIAARHDPAPPGTGPVTIGPLPERVDRGALGSVDGVVTIGLRDRDLLPARVTLVPGLPFVITGPPRCGRSHALDLVLDQAPSWPRTVHRRSADPVAFLEAARRWLAEPRPHVFAIDDAEALVDADGALEALATCRHPEGLLLVAVRADAWRSAYGTWLAALRPASTGLALSPDPARDGDGWTVALPRLAAGAPPGRGVLVDDDGAEVVQVADG